MCACRCTFMAETAPKLCVGQFGSGNNQNFCFRFDAGPRLILRDLPAVSIRSELHSFGAYPRFKERLIDYLLN